MKGLLCILIFIFAGCGISDKLSRENLSTYYDSALDELEPSSVIYHFSPDSSSCYFKIPFSNLLTVNNGVSFVARVKVHFELFATYNAKTFTDSGTVFSEALAADSIKWLYGSFAFSLPIGREAIIKLVYKDVNRKVESLQLINCKKTSAHDAQCYLLTDTFNNPLYQSYLLPGEAFKVKNEMDSADLFTVRCYFHHYPFAYPPFKSSSDLIFNYAADSIFTITKNNISSLKLRKFGFYFFQTDTALKKGITIFIFGNEYPLVTKAEELIEPTRYLTTQKEFDNLSSATNKKKAADEFWLSLSGDPERAREAIRSYYGRTQDANKLFSSYVEGWKSDRGMIYILYGPPRSVYRDGLFETWTYNTNPGTPELLFTFKKMGNPFTDQDYTLIREPSYESIWYLAVEQWRQGRIVTSSE